MSRIFLVLLVIAGITACKAPIEKGSNPKPNIVVIYLDDLGYGDVSAYGATEIQTPNMDRLANGGIRFTNGYAAAATCTPSRYALLTGIYPWRNEGAKILHGTAPLLIDTTQSTIPRMLKEQGYRTGIVGKWHLGLGAGRKDWNQKITPGPNELGFDHSFIMAATQDRVPTVYIRNGFVVGLQPEDPLMIDYTKNFEGEPTGKDNPELITMGWDHGHNQSIVNGIPRIGYMKGGKAAYWKDTEMADRFLSEATEFIDKGDDEPFFLYYAMQQPHVPRTPHPRFVGSTDMGPRGDVIIEADWCIGQFIDALEEKGLLENTLIILTSDNGPVLNDGYLDQAIERVGDHTPWGPLRGGKYSLFDAGTHVPFIAYWKGRIEPKVSEAIICQVDLYSSLAAIVGSEEKGRDSKDLSECLLGKSEMGREDLIITAQGKTALRSGDWMMIPPYPGDSINRPVNIETGYSDKFQLYHLASDIGQRNNLASSNPEKLAEMKITYADILGSKGENNPAADGK